MPGVYFKTIQWQLVRGVGRIQMKQTGHVFINY